MSTLNMQTSLLLGMPPTQNDEPWTAGGSGPAFKDGHFRYSKNGNTSKWLQSASLPTLSSSP